MVDFLSRGGVSCSLLGMMCRYSRFWRRAFSAWWSAWSRVARVKQYPVVFAPGGGGECAAVDAVGDGERFDAEEYGGFGSRVEGLLSLPVVGVREAICDVSHGVSS